MAFRSGLILAGVILLAVSGILTGEATPRWQQEEAWETRVLKRVLSGEVLYRDTFYGTGPLAIYLLQLWAKLFNSGVAEPWLLRLQNFGAYLGHIAILTWVMARHVRAHTATVAMVALASLVWLRPFPNSTYNNVAFLFMAATLALSFERRWFWCGVATGLAFCSKQNVGGLSLLFALPFAFGDAKWQSVVRLGAGFFAAVACCVAALGLQGGLPGFIEFGFLAKGNYLRNGVLWPEWRSIRPTLSWQWLQNCSILAIPFSVIAPLLFRHDTVGLRLGLFALAATLATGPRFDIVHTLLGLPAALCAFAFAVERWNLRRYVVPCVVAAALTLGWFQFGVPVRAAITGESRDGGMFRPQYRGLYLQADQLDAMIRMTKGIPKEVAYVISSRASLIYEATGIHNPTRYDYPLSTSMGLHGQQDVIDYLDQHRDACVWQEDDPSMPLHPLQLEAYIRAHLTQISPTFRGAMYCRAAR